MYNAIRDLRIKLDIKGGKVFSDEVTGIKLSRRELLSLEKLYESMLINTHDKFFPDSSPMHSVKQENDGMKWGVSIHDELSAFTGKKMSRTYTNTAQKDFFGEASDEVRKSVNDFVYDAVKKRAKRKKAEKTPLSELERFYEKHNLPYISEEQWEYMRQILTEIDEIEAAKKALDAKNERIGALKAHIAVETETIKKLILNTNTARGEFVKISKSFPKSVVNKNTGKEIAIARNGIDKFLSGRITKEKYATGAKIPELIESAYKVGEAPNKEGRNTIKGYEYYQNQILIDDVEYDVHIRVRNTNNGDKYYGHTISKVVEDIKIEPAARVSNKDGQPVIKAYGSTNNTVSQDSNTVKDNIRKKGKKIPSPSLLTTFLTTSRP